MPYSPSATARGWFKSSFSTASGDCVEVRFDGDVVQVRDTKDQGSGPVLTLAAPAWDDFLRRLLSGSVEEDGALAVLPEPRGGAILRAREDGAALRYTRGEWEMFMRGVRAGEFTHSAVVARAS
ncbi:DUF397 domain-containing protein [Saccharothrix texasensis]|uniref:Uncharacterized protein DUF397 n=1 Tax=Saccharothrix texasensis TaxID=103734 RepID=A0A3N1H2H4_9PSEU|nr:DUF397 domain-containing protein [Saccharothrix texasensis]ROP36711.1 uncharacterized protein DUF397 [Saccharothrix texasensis]